MLDLPGHPLLDKDRLIGGCRRLRVTVDARRLREEMEGLPAHLWSTQGARGGVHQMASAVYLRGYAPANGDKPIGDRPALAFMPYARTLIQETLGGSPLRCLLARLPAGALIPPHIDIPPYFGKSIRLHIPVVTNADAWMYCAGAAYRMRAGEVWALNNSAKHGVWNASATEARTHLIADFLAEPALLALLAEGEAGLAEVNPELERRMLAAPPAAGPY